MSEPTHYEIVVRGRPSTRLLHPFVDDFSFESLADGDLRLVGIVRDSSHLHGLLAHLTSVNVAVIRIGPVAYPSTDLPTPEQTSDQTPERHQP